MEKAIWIDWWQAENCDFNSHRVYFGHETCERLLPSCEVALELGKYLVKNGIEITLVTPPLTNSGLDRVSGLVKTLGEIQQKFEVVCNDWGLLDVLSRLDVCEVVLGRWLAGQQTDPRIMRFDNSMYQHATQRILTNFDGETCLLKYRPPTDELRQHYQSLSIDKSELVQHLAERKISRCELSNTGQGISINHMVDWSFTLHVPEVPIAVTRRCPGYPEDFNQSSDCSLSNCSHEKITWHNPNIPVKVFRRDNAIYYEWEILPSNFSELPINRIVSRTIHW